jgi:hypothetical protein
VELLFQKDNPFSRFLRRDRNDNRAPAEQGAMQSRHGLSRLFYLLSVTHLARRAGEILKRIAGFLRA